MSVPNLSCCRRPKTSTIPDLHGVSRLLFEPSMRDEYKDLLWPAIFQFPSADGCVESVVWRRHARTLKDVHKIGCEKQTNDRAKGRSRSTYFGSITGNVAAIRGLRSKSGISITVVPEPSEGIHHAHLGFSAGYTKVDRTELKVMLHTRFGSLDPHSCP